jgi:hypothetical protein
VISASSVGVAFAAVAVIQSGLAVWVDRAPLFGDAFRKIVADRTRDYGIDGMQKWFHEEPASPSRLDAIVRIGSLASRVTTYLAALMEAIVGLAVAVVIAFIDKRGLEWEIPSSLLLILALVFLGKLGNRIRRGTLRDFLLKRPSRKGVFDTPGPYLVMTVVTAIFTAIAGLAAS